VSDWLPEQGEHTLQSVTVSAPARLHLGFLDLGGSLGRVYGSIGLAVNSHYTTIELSAAEQTQVQGDISPELVTRIESFVQRFFASLGQAVPHEQRGLFISVREHIPEHAGLGSGTQLALTLGKALAEFFAIPADANAVAAAMQRGKRSGIGIATFQQGGFVVDGGVAEGQLPPLLMQHSFPEDWRVLMIMDQRQQGVHGQQESSAFRDLPTFPKQEAQAICHLTLMQLLPALYESNIDAFGDAVTQIQQRIGDHFAPAQGGRFSSEAVAQLLHHAQTLGHHGIAQSSWGPTGCVFVDSYHKAEQLLSQLQDFAAQSNIDGELSLIIAEADRFGAVIESTAAAN
jgi:beta-RFAP synthase